MYGFPDTRVSTSFHLIRRMGASTSLALPDRIAVSESMHSHQPRWVFVPVRVRDPATGRVQGFGPFRNGEPFVPSVRITSPGPATSTLANRTQLRWCTNWRRRVPRVFSSTRSQASPPGLGSVLARALAGPVVTGVGFFATHDAIGPDLLARRPMRSAHCDAAGWASTGTVS